MTDPTTQATPAAAAAAEPAAAPVEAAKEPLKLFTDVETPADGAAAPADGDNAAAPAGDAAPGAEGAEGDAAAKDAAADDKKPPEKPVDEADKLAERWQNVTTRDAQVTRREKAIKAREEEITQMQTSLADLRTQARSDPVGFLEKFNVTIQDVVAFIQSDGKPTEDTLREDKVSKLEAELATVKQQVDARAQQEQEEKAKQQVSQIVAEIQEKVDNSDKFPLIKARGVYHEVWEVIQLHYTETGGANGGILMSDEEAAEKVEKYYRDFAQSLSVAAPQASPTSPPGETKPAVETAPAAPAPAAKPGTGTLSNQLQDTAPNRADASGLSDEESKKRAAGHLKWE